MKKVSHLVEFVSLVNDDVEPEDISFDIPVEQVIPQANGKDVGRLLGYTTQAGGETNAENLDDNGQPRDTKA